MGDTEKEADEGTQAERDEAAATEMMDVEGSMLIQLMHGPLAIAG